MVEIQTVFDDFAMDHEVLVKLCREQILLANGAVMNSDWLTYRLRQRLVEEASTGSYVSFQMVRALVSARAIEKVAGHDTQG